MKTIRLTRKTIRQCLLPVLTGIALLCLRPAAFAQDLVVDSFDNASSVNYGNTPGLDWSNFRSENVTTVWDPTQDSTGNPNSGSMYVTVDWPGPTDSGFTTSWTDMQFAFSTGGTFESTDYIQFDVDIKVDVTNSFTAMDGTYGAIELIVNNPWNNVVGWAQLAATNGWQHFTGFFSAVPGGSYDEAIVGLISQGSGTFTNTVNYWIDNVVFTALPAVNTNQPLLSIGKAPPAGLTCICSQGGGTYQRQIIRTENSDYSWNTATASSNTVTYTMNIAAFPGVNYQAFAAQLFLIPEAGMIGTPADSDIDWDSADVADLYVNIDQDGSATATFQYKVNQSSSWNASLIVTNRCAAGPLGQWKLTFNNNTNVTLIAPDNTSTNFTIPAGDAAQFADPLFVYVGDQPNAGANIGQSATISQVKITGAEGSINENFSVLDPSIWVNDTSSDPLGIIITAPDAKYSVSWPTPDLGFSNLFATDNLTNSLASSQWLTLPSASTGWILVGGVERLAIVNQSTLNTAFGYAPTNCFFGLYHP